MHTTEACTNQLFLFLRCQYCIMPVVFLLLVLNLFYWSDISRIKTNVTYKLSIHAFTHIFSFIHHVTQFTHRNYRNDTQTNHVSTLNKSTSKCLQALMVITLKKKLASVKGKWRRRRRLLRIQKLKIKTLKKSRIRFVVL